MFPLYLQYLLIDFRRTFVTGASWDTDDLITFLGQKVKVQGHTIAAEAHSTRRYRRVQLFLVYYYYYLRGECSAFLSVARSLLAAGKMEFGSTVLTVVEPPGDYIYDDDDYDGNDRAAPEAASNVVRVSSIPHSMSLEMLKTFLESEKIGAGPIYDIRYSDGDDSAIVCFQHADGRPNITTFIRRIQWWTSL